MKSEINKWERWLWIAILIAVFFIQIDLADFEKKDAPSQTLQTPPAGWFVFDQVFETLRNEYIDEDKTSVENLIYGAVEGMLKALDDPHSYFLDAGQYQQLRSETRGSYGGVGIYAAKRKEELVVVDVIEGTPAWKAGLMRRDIIHQVDGESAYGLSSEKLTARLRGPLRTPVNLSVLREGEDSPLHFKLIRSDIKIKSVIFTRVEGTDIGYIKIRNFSLTTPRDVRKALGVLEKQNIAGLVVDLRYNPGGLLASVCEVVDMFIGGGKIVSTRDRHGKIREEYEASSGMAIRFHVPVVVLINGFSASASEVFAGALQDHRRALLIGEKTFGKFSVQELKEIVPDSKTAYKLTTTRYYLPGGRSLDGEGISPDIPVSDRVFSKHEEEGMSRKSVRDRVRQYLERHQGISLDDARRGRLREMVREEGVFLSDIAFDFLLQREQSKNAPSFSYETRFDPPLKEALRILKAKALFDQGSSLKQPHE